MEMATQNTSQAVIIYDCHDGCALEDIKAASDRARSLLARNYEDPCSVFQENGIFNVMGAIDMIDGMEYHFNLVCVDRSAFHRQHNIIAYLNRVGQFYNFLRSPFVSQFLLDVEKSCPTLFEKYGLRRKVSAHRSIDTPQKETAEEHLNSALAFTVMDCPEYEGGAYTYSALVNGTTVSLCLEKDHPVIMSEAYSALEKIITAKRLV